MEAIKEALTFDDVLLFPRFSKVLPSDTDISLNLTKNIKLKTPFLSSAMDTVTESAMAIAIAKSGGIGIINRNLDIKKQSKEVEKVKKKNLFVGAAIGTNIEDLKRAKSLLNSGVDLIVIDTAHGHSKKVLEILSKVKKNSKIPICAGNIATAEAAKKLYNSGVDIIKVGIGPGSICTTRMVAGIGVPQITAVMEVSKALKGKNIKIISDGGIKFSGDIAKAIAAGADGIMMGSIFAGTEESPGKKFKVSRSGVENFKDCPRCFYLNVRKGLKDIDTIPFTLNNTVDSFVKAEFDHCREKQIPHEVMKDANINAVPFQHIEIDNWRNARSKGVEYYHKKLNLILSGGVDDVWTIKDSKPPELIIVDYKAQAKKEGELNTKSYLDDRYHQGYKFQLDFYRYLFHNLGFKVHKIGYFLV